MNEIPSSSHRMDGTCMINPARAGASAPPSRILDLHTLSRRCAALRSKGQKIVLCHGVFDLLHVGHIRHLRAAKAFGDILVVTLTHDPYVNKGPDRPAFPSELRAEFLASLEFVDYVGIVDDGSALPAIRAVKPAFYVKGDEYADAESDITGKIRIEQELVNSLGGKLVFTHDIKFSSSSLLNRHFAARDVAAKAYLEAKRDSGLEKRITGYLEQIAKLKIVIIGETIIDRYVYVAPMGKAAKENIIATLYRDEEEFAGGAIAAANHLCSICPNVELVTMLGDGISTDNFENFVRERLNSSVQMTVIHRPDGPTVQKTRFVEPTYIRKLFEVYHMDDRPLPRDVQDGFHLRLMAKLKDADLVIVNDFGHGLISSETVEILQYKSKFLAVNAQSNAGNVGYNLINKYKKANFICIDATEAQLAVHDKHANLSDVVAKQLPAIINCPNIVVTHGRAGCFAGSKDGNVVHIPAFNSTVVDTVGAGDAFFVMAAPMLAVGADCETAGFMGNVAGAISIGIVGHRRYLNKLEIRRYVTTLLK
jgi:rfaE bifunctional protein nucleotidyltransferase chain/domain